MFKENNNNNNIETYCVMENLHNSSYFNLFSEDKISGQKIINDDFVEFTHNKLYQTGVYGKIEQAIMSKMQVYNENNNKYLNYSFDEKRKNQLKEIQFELKEHSKSKRKVVEKFGNNNNELKIQGEKKYGNIVFVDPWYTSGRCPKCNQHLASKSSFRNTKTDQLDCKRQDETNCEYESKNAKIINLTSKSVEISKAYEVISTGDENGAFFIGLRGVKSIK